MRKNCTKEKWNFCIKSKNSFRPAIFSKIFCYHVEFCFWNSRGFAFKCVSIQLKVLFIVDQRVILAWHLTIPINPLTMTDSTKEATKEYTLERDCELRFEIESKTQVIVEVCFRLHFINCKFNRKSLVLVEIWQCWALRNRVGKGKEIHIPTRSESCDLLLPGMSLTSAGKSWRLLHGQRNSYDSM